MLKKISHKSLNWFYCLLFTVSRHWCFLVATRHNYTKKEEKMGEKGA